MGLTKEADMGIGSKCLVCYTPYTRSKLKKSSWGGDGVDKGGNGSSSSVIDKQLSVMFILRNLLEVPSERLHLFLSCLGNPERWVWVCPKCNEDVRDAIKVHEELVRVTRSFKGLQERVIKAIRGSCRKQPATDGELWNQFGKKLWITDQSRQFVVTHDYGAFKDPFVSGDAQARQLAGAAGIGSTVLWVEAEKQAKTSTSVPSVDPLSFEEDPIKIELENEESYFDLEPLPMDSEPMENRDDYQAEFMADKISGASLHDENDDDRNEESDFDEGKILAGEGNYFEVTQSKNIKCLKCGILSRTKKEFVGHMRLHKTSPYRCSVCNRVYSNHKAMYRHIYKTHPDAMNENREMWKRQRQQSCVEEEGSDFSEQSDFDELKVRQEGEGVYFHKTQSAKLKCLKCGAICPNIGNFVGHVELHKTSPFKCKVCKRVYETHKTLRVHLLKYHRDTVSDIAPRKLQEVVKLMEDQVTATDQTRSSGSFTQLKNAGTRPKSTRTKGEANTDSSDQSDIDEEKIRQGEGVYFCGTKSGTLKCLRCGDFHQTLESFVEHVKLHKTSPYHCKVCKRVYRAPKALRVHELSFHREIDEVEPPRKYRKKLKAREQSTDDGDVDDDNGDEEDDSEGFNCDEGHPKEGKHYVRTPSRLYKCLKCLDRKYSMASLIHHLKLHKKSPHRCHLCKKVYTAEAYLRKHVQTFHASASEVTLQRRVNSARMKTRRRHMSVGNFTQEVESDPSFFDKCTICNVTMSATKIEAHNDLWHTISNKNDESNSAEPESIIPGEDVKLPEQKEGEFKGYNCEKCKKEFKTSELFLDHVELHKTSPFHCHICIQVFTNHQLLSSHIWLSHNRRGEIPSKDKMRRKLNPITKSGLIRCMKCLRCFPKHEIEVHNELHETSPHNCKFCGNVFTDESKLRMHLGRFHRQLYERMKAINPKDPTAVMEIEIPEMPSDENQVKIVKTCENEYSSDSSVELEMKGDADWTPDDTSSTGTRPKRTKRTLKKSGGRKIIKTSGIRYSCPACKYFSFRAEASEELCTHLENCPEVKDEADSSTGIQNLCCPICKSFETSVSNLAEFGEHLLSCEKDSESKDVRTSVPLSRRIFECDICPKKRYFRLEGFLQHYKFHTVKTRVLKCTQCFKNYPNQSAMAKHWGNCHSTLKQTTPIAERFSKEKSVPEANWWCSVCGEKFPNEDQRDSHIQTDHSEHVPEKTHVCSTCQKEYACPDELKLHTEISHESAVIKRLVACDVCNYLCRTQAELDNHKRRKHRVNLFICEICATECNSKNNLECHMQLHQEVRKYPCDECPSSFTASQYLRHHKFREHTPHDKKVNPLVCKFCDKVLSSPHYLRVHIAVVHELKFTVFCEICGFGAIHKSILRKHMIIKHNIGERKTWKCDVEGCDRTFKDRRSLQNHKDQHEGNPQFACEYCGKGFYNKTHLTRHKQIHSNADSKPYVCQVCGKRFPVRNYLYIHLRSHRNKE